MNRVTEIQEAIYDASNPSSFQSQPPKRCHSVPSQPRGNWVAREKLYVPGEKPVRSISLTSRVTGHQGRSRLAEAFRPAPAGEGLDGHITPQTDDYDSDEEDRRNGVPVTYSQNRCLPFRASMRSEVEAGFRRLKLHADQLSATLREWEPSYKELRRAMLGPLGQNWTASQWEEFFILEDAFFTLQDELFTIQDQMQNMNAQMYLFLDHSRPPSRDWLHNENATLWSPDGKPENRARNGDYPVLEWNGVDYNALD